jgi:hypothetical protein
MMQLLVRLIGSSSYQKKIGKLIDVALRGFF